MKGATPSGPIAFASRRPKARTTACAGIGSREKRAMTSSGKRGGRYCEPMPTAIASSTSPLVTGGVLLAIAVGIGQQDVPPRFPLLVMARLSPLPIPAQAVVLAFGLLL